MKKFFSILIFSFCFLTGNFAQQSSGEEPKMPDPKDMAQHETDQMKKGLLLTDSQTVKVNSVNLKFAQQRLDMVREVRASGDMSQIQNKVEGLELAKNEDLRPILSEEQMKKWPKVRKKMQDEMMNRGSSGMHQNGGMRGGGGMRQNDYGVNHQ